MILICFQKELLFLGLLSEEFYRVLPVVLNYNTVGRAVFKSLFPCLELKT